jgi:hypothetical protein
VIEIIRFIFNWNTRKRTSDITKVKVTEGGGFYMRSEDLFSNKEKSLELLDKLNKI